MADRVKVLVRGVRPEALEPLASRDGQNRTLEPALQALFEYDPLTEIVSWSDSALAGRLLQMPELAEMISKSELDRSIVGGDVAARTLAFAGGVQSYSCEYRIGRDSGQGQWIEERGGWVGTGSGRRLIGVIRSIDSQKQYEAHLAWLAENDELTGVMNRGQMRVQLDEALKQSKATNSPGAYLLAGVDDVGAINADFGFDVADEVIVECSRRLQAVLGPQDLIGRVAGTKFGIALVNADSERVREVCVKLLNAMREQVIDTQKGGVASSLSIGAVETPRDADTAHKAMACAEAALDQAKRLGRSSWSSFSEKTEVVSMRRRNTHMSDVILTALNERRVRLAFQPIVADLGESPTKFECLIRMRAEDGREVPAPEFIPVAEKLGLVHLLDRRVLQLAINTLAACPNMKLNVNVSMETVKDPVWADGYLAVMRANESLCRRITVELTETQVIDAIDASIEFVSEIKKQGAAFGIDDFGAGYTSFRNLKALDIDILKIDGSFVTGVASSRENQLFVRTLLDLARNFGMKTVAEWVDNEADAMLLKGLGVDFLQGYLIGKPETAPAWLPDGAPNESPLMQIRALG
ncbi:MAG: EAL domain-containing protein [Parvularculaceae bacterium]|nr:EAL domain-containing protein [Parvularculaceae bacterium]